MRAVLNESSGSDEQAARTTLAIGSGNQSAAGSRERTYRVSTEYRNPLDRYVNLHRERTFGLAMR